MKYKLKEINPIERTILIEWEDGTTLNHKIPVQRIRMGLLRLPGLIRNRADITPLMNMIVRKERP